MNGAIAAGDDGLTPRQMRAAQRNFTLFSFLNVVSFHLLTGNLIALYALRLGAGDLLVGVLYSFLPLGQLVPLLGRLIVRRLGTVRTMGIFWIARYALMSPILLAPLFANNAAPVSIWLIAASAVGFNLARGVAITGHNAIVGAITTETERGSFLSRNQLVIHAAGIGAGLAIGLLLQEESPLWLYSLLMGSGIVIGLSSTRLAFRFPEPPAPNRADGFFGSLRRTVQRRGVARFLTLLAVHSFAVSMVIPFLVVYAKRAHGLGDNTAMLLGAVGWSRRHRHGAGERIRDRPGRRQAADFAVHRDPGGDHGNAGRGAAARQRHRGVGVPGRGVLLRHLRRRRRHQRQQRLLFQPHAERRPAQPRHSLLPGRRHPGVARVARRRVGARLPALGGRVLDTADVYRIYFGALAVAYVGILLLASRIERLGAYRVHDLLGLFASPRDLRALALLHRLKGSSTSDSEQSLVRRLGDAPSRLAAPDLLRRLDSPRFAVRSEALDSLADMPATDELARALIAEVAGQPFTTAHKAADLIGRKQLADGVEVLRGSLASPDVFLVGKAMVSLARLGDQASRAPIEELFRSTGNPRLLIHGAAALELFGDPASLDDVLAVLERAPSRYVRDELILSAAGILEMANNFYPLYQGFLADARHGLAMVTDYVAEQQERARLEPPVLALVTALVAAFADPPAFSCRRPRRVGTDSGGGARRAAHRHPHRGAAAAGYRNPRPLPLSARRHRGVLRVAPAVAR